MWRNLFFLVVIAWLSSSFFSYVRNLFFHVPPLPVIKEERWWGPGKPYANEDTSIKPFSINVSEEVSNLFFLFNFFCRNFGNFQNFLQIPIFKYL